MEEGKPVNHYSFDTSHAIKYGVDCAVVIRFFQFWISKNAANGRHQHDGRTWTYNTKSALAKMLPFWTQRQVEWIVKKLVDQGVLVVGNYNSTPYDRTLWYAFCDESIYMESEFHFTNLLNGNCRSVEPIPVKLPVVLPVKKYKEPHGRFANVLLAPNEFETLVQELGDSRTSGLIEELSEYIESKGKKYKSHYATILAWSRMKERNGRKETFAEVNDRAIKDAMRRQLAKEIQPDIPDVWQNTRRLPGSSE